MEPNILISQLDEALPGFSEHVLSEGNLFDGGTLHAVFASCSHYVRERPVPVGSWPRLAKLINEAVAGSDGVISEAACTCFLENLADPGHPIKRHLEGKALRFWQEVETAG